MTTDTTKKACVVPISGQSFSSHQDWVNRAKSRLTCHPKYHNTEHDGPAKGWRGPHFVALCFDQNGMRCRNGGDMASAAYPVWWVWPDQIAGLIMIGSQISTANSEARND